MPLHVLYVEDTEREVKLLKDELALGNSSQPEWSKIRLTPISHPSALPDALSKHPDVDVVLADVYYQPIGTASPVQETDHLDQIINAVEEWDKKSPHGFPTPVIAYTGRGQTALKKCLERRGKLYDIWDKLSTGSEYVMWRFQRLASELPRHRPDATIQKLIIAMPSEECPPWHTNVCNLVKSYGEGHSEHEQVKNCRDNLQSILNMMNAKNTVALMRLWDGLAASEPLLRAASPKLRGIARHSINVFWFGYWLINHPLFREQICKLWEQMRDSRADVPDLKTIKPIDGINNAWLLTSLFHDAGKIYEHGKTITDVSIKYFKEFVSLEMGCPSWINGKADTLPKSVEQVLFRLSRSSDDPMVKELREHITRCSNQEKPDHGAIAAAYLVNIGGGPDATDLFSQYANEAARAIMLHSCLPSVFDKIPKDKLDKCPQLEWQREPLACLLLFCDQIQTWDRHDTEVEKDYPDRAELSYLNAEIDEKSGKPQLKGCIDYIAPSRIAMYPELRKDIAKALNKVILEKPKDTLLHVLQEGQWPFSVHLDCALSCEKLSIDMDFN